MNGKMHVVIVADVEIVIRVITTEKMHKEIDIKRVIFLYYM